MANCDENQDPNPLENIIQAAREFHEKQAREAAEQQDVDDTCFLASMATANTEQSLRGLDAVLRALADNEFQPGDIVKMHPALNSLFRFGGPFLVTEVREVERYTPKRLAASDIYGDYLDTRVAFFNPDGETISQQWVDRRRLVLLAGPEC